MGKKRNDKKMNTTSIKQTQTTKRQERIKASYNKAVEANGKALEKLSKN
ncbi:hypothetical protein [Pseudalkalibacillus caeni]|nr:hypothetical protein [Pseudalkalibacillus caeni]